MTGQLNLQTIGNANGSETVDTDYVISGSAKAYVRWSQSGTHTATKSLNVTSLTDQGTGYTRVGLTTAMADLDYIITGMAGELTGGGNRYVGQSGVNGVIAEGAFGVRANNSSGTATDCDYVSVCVLGDLA